MEADGSGQGPAGEVAGEWTSIAEAARRFGVSRRAVRDRIGRGTLTARQGNRAREVFVPAGVLPAAGPGSGQGGDGELRQRLAAAEREVELVREMLETERGQHREALAQLRGDRDQLAALLKAALDRPSWLERLARAVRGRI